MAVSDECMTLLMRAFNELVQESDLAKLLNIYKEKLLVCFEQHVIFREALLRKINFADAGTTKYLFSVLDDLDKRINEYVGRPMPGQNACGEQPILGCGLDYDNTPNFRRMLEGHTIQNVVRLYNEHVFNVYQLQAIREVIQHRIVFEDTAMMESAELSRVLNELDKKINPIQHKAIQQDHSRRGTDEDPHTHTAASGSVITFLSESSRTFKKFRLTGRRIRFKYTPYDGSMNPLSYIQGGLDEVLQHGVRNFNNDDRIGLVFHNDDFPERPVAISFRRKDQLAVDVILERLAKILQSNAAFFTTGVLTLAVDRVEMPRLHGLIKLPGATFEEFCRRKRGVLEVSNDDNNCLVYAVVAGIAYKTNKDDFNKLINNKRLLEAQGRRLCQISRINLSHGATIDQVRLLQDYLYTLNIILMIYNRRDGKSLFFKGLKPNHVDPIIINLLIDGAHVNLILSLTACFCAKYFCEKCSKRYSNKERHLQCPYKCPCCHSPKPCSVLEVKIECSVCRRVFRGPRCFETHKPDICKTYRKCNNCLSTISGNKKHTCGMKFCSLCCASKPIRHLCYMQPNKLGKRRAEQLREKFIIVFFDLECTQNKEIGDGMFLHEPNLCIAQQVCSLCVDRPEPITNPCTNCGVRSHIFRDNPVKAFTEYLARLMLTGLNIIVLAHNMKSYDGCFLAKEFLKDVPRWDPKFIRTGCKFISIVTHNVKIIDSINYMPLPLAKLPATFNFEGSKGYFPHLFNTVENANYYGVLPDAVYYMPDKMSTVERTKFYRWYNDEVSRNVQFDMKNEIVAYCTEDVNILRTACLKFRKFFLDTNLVDPFQESVTIAGACNLVFRRNFLKNESIALLPQGGYRMLDGQSLVALKWLHLKETSSTHPIKHAGNGREVRLPSNLLVDGFCAETNTVYEFYGCYYHGCERCYPKQTTSKFVDNVGADINNLAFIRREKTVWKETKLLALGYNVEAIWECEFKKLLKDNDDMRVELEKNFNYKHTPLNPRDAFFGGRTNAIKLHYECQDSEKIYYFDVCSLYPYCNKYGCYPVGHPTVIIGDEACKMEKLDTLVGIIKCTVLPPQKLYLPVLPYRCNGKLTFPICRTCAETVNHGVCNHNVRERQLNGTYVAAELILAVSLGYQVLEYYEIWKYASETYNRETKEGGLFAGYIDKFLKLKQECSGWPEWCTTPESKELYLKQYRDVEGIVLDANNIQVNPGMRYLSKLQLNSFWGKFGQRENVMQTTAIKDATELFQLLSEPLINVHNLVIIDDDVLLACWDKLDDNYTPLRTVNVVIAAVTTCLARLELYKYLHKLGDRVLYFDTDSVIFKGAPGDWMPETGDFLGQLTDEISPYGEGSYITEFVSGGPKNYALKIFSTKINDFVYVCKVKGITMNFENAKIVNFNTLKGMVCEGTGEKYVYNPKAISRVNTCEVVSKPEQKVYRLCYTKRKRVNAYDTLPYGYLSD